MAIAKAQLVMSQADGTRIVRAFRLPQRLGEKRDTAGRLAAGDGQPTVHAPQVRKPGGIKPLAPFGRLPKRLSRLTDIVLEKPRLSEGTSNLDLLVAMEPGLPQRPNQQGCRFDPSARVRALALPVRRDRPLARRAV